MKTNRIVIFLTTEVCDLLEAERAVFKEDGSFSTAASLVHLF